MPVTLFAAVKLAASELGLTIHEVWAHRRDQKLYLEMHVGVDPQFTLGQAHERVDRLGAAGDRAPAAGCPGYTPTLSWPPLSVAR